MHISINFAYAGLVAGLILTHHLTASTPTAPLLSAVLSRAYNKAFFPGFHGPSCVVARARLNLGVSGSARL